MDNLYILQLNSQKNLKIINIITACLKTNTYPQNLCISVKNVLIPSKRFTHVTYKYTMPFNYPHFLINLCIMRLCVCIYVSFLLNLWISQNMLQYIYIFSSFKFTIKEVTSWKKKTNFGKK